MKTLSSLLTFQSLRQALSDPAVISQVQRLVHSIEQRAQTAEEVAQTVLTEAWEACSATIGPLPGGTATDYLADLARNAKRREQRHARRNIPSSVAILPDGTQVDGIELAAQRLRDNGGVVSVPSTPGDLRIRLRRLIAFAATREIPAGHDALVLLEVAKLMLSRRRGWSSAAARDLLAQPAIRGLAKMPKCVGQVQRERAAKERALRYLSDGGYDDDGLADEFEGGAQDDGDDGEGVALSKLLAPRRADPLHDRRIITTTPKVKK